MTRHYARKRDGNHAALKAQWLAIPGTAWQDTDRQGDGCPDAVVCTRHRDSGEWVNLWVEIKDVGQARRLTPKEAAFADAWPGPYVVAETLDDLLAWFGM